MIITRFLQAIVDLSYSDDELAKESLLSSSVQSCSCKFILLGVSFGVNDSFNTLFIGVCLDAIPILVMKLCSGKRRLLLQRVCA